MSLREPWVFTWTWIILIYTDKTDLFRTTTRHTKFISLTFISSEMSKSPIDPEINSGTLYFSWMFTYFIMNYGYNCWRHGGSQYMYTNDLLLCELLENESESPQLRVYNRDVMMAHAVKTCDGKDTHMMCGCFELISNHGDAIVIVSFWYIVLLTHWGTLYDGCNYSSLRGLNLKHVIKRGPWSREQRIILTWGLITDWSPVVRIPFALSRCDSNYKSIIFKLISLSTRCESTPRRMPPTNITKVKSTYFQVMDWCCQTSSHYLIQF